MSRKLKKTGLMVRLFGTFWATVISVELMDIAFSVDAIFAAFAISNQIWILLVGGMLGILMMRTIAGLFLIIIEKKYLNLRRQPLSSLALLR